jgi:hypothetical protein
MPVPIKTPPKIHTSNLSCVITWGYGKNWRHILTPIIAASVFQANRLFTWNTPIIIKGILAGIITYAIFLWYNSEISRDIPVTPPSKKLFGTRKHFRANPQIKIPAII